MRSRPLELRNFREERGRGPDAPAQGVHHDRRLVLISGMGPARNFGPGDVAILDRPAVGRRSLLRLADELALRGAAGLIVSEETIAPLPEHLRRSIEERVPLLVVGSDWDRAKAWLLEAEPSVSRMHPDTALRAILRGEADAGPRPTGIDPNRTTQAVVIVAYLDGDVLTPLSKLEEIAAAEAEMADPRSHVVSVDGTVALLCSQDGAGRDAATLGKAILERVTSVVPASGVTVGIGRGYSGWPGIRRTYREARWAATVGELLWAGNRVVSFRELGIYGLLEPFVRDPSTTDTQDVQKLLDYDHKHQTALLPTVETYFDSGRSGEVAASLFVHRNTIAYRLRSVRRITGLDIVHDPDARLLLEVQVRLARLWGILPATPAPIAVGRLARRGRPTN